MSNNQRVTAQEMRSFMEAAHISMPRLAAGMRLSVSSLKHGLYDVRPFSELVTKRFYQFEAELYQAAGGKEEFYKIINEYERIQDYIDGNIK